jgi:copper chaperone CopZ
VTTAIQASAPNADVEIAVDLEEETVTVDGIEDERAIASAIEDAGFTFEGAL